MHNIFAGMMGFFMSIASIFHMGNATPATQNQTPNIAQSTLSGTPAPKGAMRGSGRGMMRNLPNGDKPFFGTVTNVNGSTITIQMQMMMRPNRLSGTPSVTPPASRTITVHLDSSTKYTGGTQTDITTNIRVAGFGKPQTDGSITAAQIQINPTVPSGIPHRRGGPDDKDGQQ